MRFGLTPKTVQPLMVIRWHFGAGIYKQTLVKNIEKRKRFLRKEELWFEVETMVEPSGYPERGSLYACPSISGWIPESTMSAICMMNQEVRLAQWSWI